MPESFGQSKTVFYTEGNTTALLDESINGRRRQRPHRFENHHHALDWCVANAAVFVFFPVARSAC